MNELPWTIPGGQQIYFRPHTISGQGGGDAVVTGNGALRSEDYTAGSAGWRIGGDGTVEFNSGTFRGAISGSTIDIGGSDTTSFHVDASGNLWLGASSFASAPFKVSSAGDVTATSVTLTNPIINTPDITGGTATGPSIDGNATIISTGQLASANFATGTAGWAIDGAGNVEFNDGTFRGNIEAATITGSSFSVTDGTETLTINSGGIQLPVNASEAASSVAIVEWLDGASQIAKIESAYSASDSYLILEVEDPALGGGYMLARCEGLYIARGSTAGFLDVGRIDSDGDLTITQAASNHDMILLTTTANATGTKAGMRMETGSGWSTSIWTEQTNWWHAFGDSSGTVHWGYDGSRLRLPTNGITIGGTAQQIDVGGSALQFKTGSTIRLSIDASGYMYAPGMRAAASGGQAVERDPTSPNELIADTSTAKVKTDIGPVAPDLGAKLLAAELRSWTALRGVVDAEGRPVGEWEVADPERHPLRRGQTWDRPGFIVEDLMHVFPELVLHDEHGDPVGVDRGVWLAALTQVVQDLARRVPARGTTPA